MGRVRKCVESFAIMKNIRTWEGSKKCMKSFAIMAISVLSVGSNAQVRQEEPITNIDSNNRDSGKIQLLASTSQVMTFVPGLQFLFILTLFSQKIPPLLSVCLSLSLRLILF